MPAAAVTRRVRALFGITGRKGFVGGNASQVEIPELNLGRAFSRLCFLSFGEGWWNCWCRVTSAEDIGRNTEAKATTWPNTDAEEQRGEQTWGLDTLVVHAVNDDN